MLILQRTPHQALVIGGEVRVEVSNTAAHRVWLRITRLRQPSPSTGMSSGDEEIEAISFADCTVSKTTGESVTVLGVTMHVSLAHRKGVLLSIDSPGGLGVFPEEAWEDLVRNENEYHRRG